MGLGALNPGSGATGTPLAWNVSPGYASLLSACWRRGNYLRTAHPSDDVPDLTGAEQTGWPLVWLHNASLEHLVGELCVVGRDLVPDAQLAIHDLIE